jgi:hypothetical protein
MNAEYYAEKAAALAALDQELKSLTIGAHTQTKELARYHVRAAAAKLREIAEARAEQERTSKVEAAQP